MKIKARFFYLLLLVWIALLFVILRVTHLSSTGLGVILSFLSILFIPGVLLRRIFSRFISDFPRLLAVVGLGFGYYFFWALLALFFNLSLNNLVFAFLFLSILLFLLAFYLDFKVETEITWPNLKTIQTGEWILLIGVVVAAIFSFLVVDAQSDKLLGDGWFHLAVLEKIVRAPGLAPGNLSLTKDSLNIVYAFPIWHIFVALWAKMTGLNIYTAWRQILLPLTLISFLVWLSLGWIVFKNRFIVLTVFFAFLLSFLIYNNYQYLLPLASPDSFNRLLFLPVLLGLAFAWVFSENEVKIGPGIFITLLAIFLGLIHFTQLIYYFLILVTLALIFGLVRAKKSVEKSLILILLLAVLIAPYLLLVQRENIMAMLSGNAAVFSGVKADFHTFLGANVLYRYALVSLPLILFFARRERRLYGLLGISIPLLLLYWPAFGVRGIFEKYLGSILTSRSLANIPNFLYFGFLFFLVLAGISLLVDKFGRLGGWIWSGLVILAGLTVLLFGSRATLENIFFNEDKLLVGPSFWLVLIVLAAGLIIVYLRKRDITLPQRMPFHFAITSLVLFLILALPYLSKAQTVLQRNPNGSLLTNRLSENASDPREMAGDSTINYLQSLPAKSVIMAPSPTLAQEILLYTDTLAAEYPYGISDFTQSKIVYDPNRSVADKLMTLDNLGVDYVVVNKDKNLPFFQSGPFEQVYQNSLVYPVTTKKGIESQTVKISIFRFLK